MAQTAVLQQSNSFLARCSLDLSTRLHQVVDPAHMGPELSFRAATEDWLGIVGLAIARIEQGNGAEAALRELRGLLLELQGMVARDPGIRMAADDLSAAATAVVASRSAESALVDVRCRRLLREANARLRDRLASARPSAKARLSGLN